MRCVVLYLLCVFVCVVFRDDMSDLWLIAVRLFVFCVVLVGCCVARCFITLFGAVCVCCCR